MKTSTRIEPIRELDSEVCIETKHGQMHGRISGIAYTNPVRYDVRAKNENLLNLTEDDFVD